MANQTIHCGVDTCRHNEDGSACALPGITVGTDMTNCAGSPESSCQTECSSFNSKA